MKRRYQSHLHSNLVIFESERPESLKMQLKKFTFQSGDIRIDCNIEHHNIDS